MEAAREYADKEMKNAKSSKKDIDNKIKDLGKRKEDTNRNKKKAEKHLQDENLSHETRSSWKKTGETLEETIEIHGQTEMIQEETKRLAKQAVEMWARAKEEWKSALQSDTVSDMSKLSIDTQWRHSEQLAMIRKKYEEKNNIIGPRQIKEYQELYTSYMDQKKNIARWNVIKKDKLEEWYNTQRDELTKKHRQENHMINQEKAKELEQAYKVFEQYRKEKPLPNPTTETIPETEGPTSSERLEKWRSREKQPPTETIIEAESSIPFQDPPEKTPLSNRSEDSGFVPIRLSMAPTEQRSPSSISEAPGFVPIRLSMAPTERRPPGSISERNISWYEESTELIPDDKLEFLNTKLGEEWFRRNGNEWVNSNNGEKFMRKHGLEFLNTKLGGEWFRRNGNEWVNSNNGEKFMRKYGLEFLRMKQGKTWFTEHGREWLKMRREQEKTPKTEDKSKLPKGKEMLEIKNFAFVKMIKKLQDISDPS